MRRFADHVVELGSGTADLGARYVQLNRPAEGLPLMEKAIASSELTRSSRLPMHTQTARPASLSARVMALNSRVGA